MKDKEHPFYRKSKKWQSRQLLKFAGIAVLILLVVVSLITGWVFLVFLGIALLYDFLPMMLSYSIVKGKSNVSPLSETKTFTASLAAISKNKAYLKKLATT